LIDINSTPHSVVLATAETICCCSLRLRRFIDLYASTIKELKMEATYFPVVRPTVRPLSVR